MPLAQDFRETIVEELRDTEYRRAYFCEAINALVCGDLDTAKPALRIFINGTIGFVQLGNALGRSPKSLMRMLSAEGNPQARNLLEMVAYLQKIEGTTAKVEFTTCVAA